MLCLIPVFFFSPVYYVVYLGAWSLFTLYSAIKGAVDIYVYIYIYIYIYIYTVYIYIFIYLFIHSFIHKECPTGWRNGTTSCVLSLLYFTFCVLPAGNLHGFDQCSSAYDHQERRTPQVVHVDDSVLLCWNSEFMTTNASPGMMNIRAHCRITIQR